MSEKNVNVGKIQWFWIYILALHFGLMTSVFLTVNHE